MSPPSTTVTDKKRPARPARKAPRKDAPPVQASPSAPSAQVAAQTLEHAPERPLFAGPRAIVSEAGPGQASDEAAMGAVFGRSLDRFANALSGRMTAGVSPVALSQAFGDWGAHLATSPGKQAELVQKAVRKAVRLWLHAQNCATNPDTPPCIEALAQDRRFRGEAWQQWPYKFIYQSFLLNQQWWYNATTEVRGVSRHHEDLVTFAMRQALDLFSPSNFLPTNPEVLTATLQQGGANLHRGWQNFLEDWQRAIAGKPPVGTEDFAPGKNLAVTPGKVVYRNRLIELIQYAPATDEVHAEPVLIVPAWIMKYYILDLSPDNSLVRYLVEQGHTVFLISWRNPDAEDRDLGMEDYLRLGVMKALDAIAAIVPDQKVHGVGYCLGGTLLAITAAALSQNGNGRLASASMLAAQTDFAEAGELMLFIDESEVSYLEDIMWEQGYLDTKQMAGAFQMLRSNDLIWSRMVREYFMGERGTMTDLMAWNADATRMPFRMHSEYLRRLFLRNELAEGRYQVDSKHVSISDIRVPIFAVATETDHVAPWRSVYKIHLLSDTEVTFLLTNGGHNAGIVSEPGHDRRRHRISTRSEDAMYVDPDRWFEMTPAQDGSWWPQWQAWLSERSTGKTPPPPMGAEDMGYPILCEAPGSYVLLP